MTLKKDIKNLIDTYQNNRFSPLLKHRKVNFSKTAGFRGVSNVISGSTQSYTLSFSPFTPLSISDCIEYCLTDASNLSGDPVQTLINLGSSGINYVQATEANRPDRTTINGKTYINFQPTVFLKTSDTVDLSAETKISMVLAIKTSSSVETGTTWGSSGGLYSIKLKSSVTNLGWRAALDTDGSINACSGSVLFTDANYILGVTWDADQPAANAGEITKFKLNDTEDLNRFNAFSGENSQLDNLFHFLNGVNGISDDASFYYRGHALYKKALTDSEFTNLYNFFNENM